MRLNKILFRIAACSALLASLVSCNKDGGEIELQEGTNVYGYVKDSDGNPIAGAVVSDGHTCVATDGDGAWQMKAVSGTRRVFVSVPSGYEIPMGSSGLPKIYNNFVLMKGQPVRTDFTLTRAGNQNDFTLFVLADVQLQSDDAYEQLKNDVMPDILEYTATLDSPVIGVSVGDMVWDKMDFLASQYPEQISRLGFPVFHVMGNHDYDVTASSLSAADDVFENSFGPVNWSFNYGQCHFIGISDIAYKPGDKAGYERKISDETFAWLEKDLSFVSEDKLVIISMHAPSQVRDKGYSKDYLKGSERLYSMLDGYKAVLLTGHLHHNYTFDISDNIREHNHASLMGNNWSGNQEGLCNDGSPRGFTVYKVSGASVSDKYYKGARKDRDYQMQLYRPGEYDPYVGTSGFAGISKGDMVINIFNWHTDWTVTVDEDGTKTDLSGKNMKLQDKNAYRYDFLFSTDHIFKYAPKGDWQTITVTAADPYGNEYSESVSR